MSQIPVFTDVLQHPGRIGVIQGDAGAGKSSSMEAVADVIKAIGGEQGVQVRGFALQGKTSVLLEGDSGISSGTLDSFLNSKSTWDGSSRQIWVVDEYSMVDSRRLGALVDRAQAENAQVILLGDKKQLAAIGAGRLGQDLDENGLIKTVQMDESLRQKTEYAKAIDAAMKVKDVRLALEIMAKAGKLVEIKDPEDRAKAMAKAYVEAESGAREATGGKKGALAMTLTNAERQAVIREIRTLQKEAGAIGQQDHSFTTRAPVALDAVTRKLAASYREGMVAIPSRAVGEIKAGAEARVTAVDTVKNTITLSVDGKTEVLDARRSGNLMMYEERQTQLTLEEARRRHREALSLVCSGKDPQSSVAEEPQIEPEPHCLICRRCGWWTIPATRRQGNKGGEHRVFLSPLAMQLINGWDDFVFPGDKDDRPITANSVNHHVRRIVPATGKTAYYGLERWTPHDLRRTAATGFRRLGATRDEMDLILGHRAGGVTGVYDRHSGEAEKERWLTAWGEYIQRLVSEA